MIGNNRQHCLFTAVKYSERRSVTQGEMAPEVHRKRAMLEGEGVTFIGTKVSSHTSLMSQEALTRALQED